METPLLKVNSFGGGGWIQWFTYPGKEKNASITTFVGVANTQFHLERCRRYTQCRRKFKNALEIRLIKKCSPTLSKKSSVVSKTIFLFWRIWEMFFWILRTRGILIFFRGQIYVKLVLLRSVNRALIFKSRIGWILSELFVKNKRKIFFFLN